MTVSEKSMEILTKSQTLFMQTKGQMRNTYTHAITMLEVQLSLLANSLNERPKKTLPSRPWTKPKINQVHVS